MTLFLRHQIEQSARIALPWVVVCLVLIASAVVSQLPRTLTLLAIAGLVAVLGAILLLQRPGLGLVALIPACLVVPLELGTGSQSSINAGMLLVVGMLGLWLLETAARKEPIQLARSRTVTIPLLLLVCSAVVSFVVGQLPWFPVAPAPLRAQIGGVAVYVISGGAFLLAAYRIRDLHWLEWMVWTFLAIGTLYVVAALVPTLSQQLGRLVQFQHGSTGSLFWVWMVALAFSQALFNRRLNLVWRLMLAALAVATLYLAVAHMYDWKSGWLPPLAAIAAILLARWWQFVIPMGVGGLWFVADMVSEIIASDTYSFDTRVEAWVILAEIIQKSPVFGLGPANYYWYTPLYSIRGYYVQFNSHSQYVDLVAQLGIVGLVLFLWFAWEVGRLGWRLRRQASDGFMQAYIYGALGGLAGTLIAGGLGDWILPFVYNIGLAGMRSSLLGWFFLGGVVAIEGMILRSASGMSRGGEPQL